MSTKRVCYKTSFNEAYGENYYDEKMKNRGDHYETGHGRSAVSFHSACGSALKKWQMIVTVSHLATGRKVRQGASLTLA